MDTIERVKALIAPYLSENDIELVDVIYRREAGGMVLRFLVDKPYGINLKECEDLNIYLSGLLDKEDLIDNHFTLEVSSPGLDRTLKADKDFERVIGKPLNVSTFEPIDGHREHEGTLIGVEKENIVVESSGVSVVIPRNKIAKAVLKIEF